MSMYVTFDKQLELRDVADGAETETAAETGIAFDPLKAGDFKAIIYVTARAATGTVSIAIETDATDGFGGSPVSVSSVTIPVSTKGIFEIPLSSSQIAKLDPDASAIRAKATLGGTTPSVTYGAYLVPAVR